MMAWLLAALWVWADEGPARIWYSKSFPGSSPAYVAISVDEKGRGEYREAPDEENPLTFQLSEAETREIFSLAEKLDFFRRPLETNLKVAFTGQKTFRYQRGALNNEVRFNYSTDPDARALWDFFERITETEQLLLRLERAARYDRLGVNQALLQLEVAHDRNRLVAREQFLKVLDRIAKSASYINMARERAARLAEAFRAGASTGP